MTEVGSCSLDEYISLIIRYLDEVNDKPSLQNRLSG